MGLIYMRTSPSSGRYIGQTIFTEEERWEDHTREAYNINNEDYNTILNRAIRKYGPDNFISEILEDNIPDDLLDDKEIYWIDYYKTFYLDNNHGYNMTRGGRGTKKIDTERAFKLWNQGFCTSEIAQELGTFNETICKHLKMKGISSEEITARSHLKAGQKTSKRYQEQRNKESDNILKLWNEGKNIEEIKSLTNRSYKFVAHVLSELGITNEMREQRRRETRRNDVIDTDNEFYSKIMELWDNGYSIKQITEKLNVSNYRVTKSLNMANIPKEERLKRSSRNKPIPICQYDLNGNLIKEWASANEASKVLGIQPNTIRQVCNGKGKTYKGFIWKDKT